MSAITMFIMAGAVALASTGPAADDTVAGLGPVLTGGALQSLHSGETGFDPSIVVEVGNDGGVDGNVAQGNASGRNVVGGGAFGNAAGISTVIQNSGNNVLIQNGTAVNVQFGGTGP